MGSDADAEQGVPPPSTGSGLFGQSGFMDGLKKSASTFGKQASKLAHQGLEAGKQIAADPRTKQVEGEALTAGKQIVQQHKEQGIRVLEAGKRGDVQGVLSNGIPLAAEAAMHANPIGLALTLAKPKLMDMAINHVPVEHQATLKSAKTLVDGASAVTHLNIHGIGTTALLQQAARATAQEQVNTRVAGRNQGQDSHPPSPPPAVANFDQQSFARAGAVWGSFLKQQAKKTAVAADNGASAPPPQGKY